MTYRPFNNVWQKDTLKQIELVARPGKMPLSYGCRHSSLLWNRLFIYRKKTILFFFFEKSLWCGLLGFYCSASTSSTVLSALNENWQACSLLTALRKISWLLCRAHHKISYPYRNNRFPCLTYNAGEGKPNV